MEIASFVPQISQWHNWGLVSSASEAISGLCLLNGPALPKVSGQPGQPHCAFSLTYKSHCEELYPEAISEPIITTRSYWESTDIPLDPRLLISGMTNRMSFPQGIYSQIQQGLANHDLRNIAIKLFLCIVTDHTYLWSRARRHLFGNIGHTGTLHTPIFRTNISSIPL